MENAKIALINDIHIGVRGDSQIFSDAQCEFFTDIFFPTLLKNEITDVIILGDLFDRRKFINFLTIYKARVYLFDVALEHGIKLHILPGNHDVYFKSTNDVNSIQLLLDGYDNVIYYSEPTHLSLHGYSVAMLPWVNQENYKHSVSFLNDVNCDVMFAHLDVSGFKMNHDSIESKHGMDESLFSRFEQVFTGHFHQPSEGSNIRYLGAPMEFTWADADQVRGFHLYDLSTREVELIVNPIKIHYRIYYDESINIEDYDYDSMSNKIVRLIVGEKEDMNKYHLFISLIEQSNPASFDVVDNSQFYAPTEDIDDEAIENEDTMKIIQHYVAGLDMTDVQTESIGYQFNMLHTEVMNEMDI